MSTTTTSEKTVSDAQPATTEQRELGSPIERQPSARAACPECQGRVITGAEESFCSGCGLVVAAEWVDLRPTLRDLGKVGDAEKSIEPVNPLRSDKGLHTKIGTSTDGRGKPLSNERWEKIRRLRKWHRRYQFGPDRKREKRLNEGLRDVELIGGNMGLPDYVIERAARYLRRAADARLPGGRMAWEALAGGAVLLATRAAAVERTALDTAVATYAKAPRERVCAAARKVRCELEGKPPVVRPDAVLAVVDALADDALQSARAVRTWQLARHLLALGDRVPVGPGTSRLTVSAAALYAADRLLPGKHLTQQQVADAASAILPTSRHRIKRYSRELVEAYEAKYGTNDPTAGLEHVSATQG